MRDLRKSAYVRIGSKKWGTELEFTGQWNFTHIHTFRFITPKFTRVLQWQRTRR